jgi:DNA-binding CsgD family transcriptional regulator/PAS domain-containing protein
MSGAEAEWAARALSAAPVAALTLDEDDRVVWANSAAGELLEQPADRLQSSAASALLTGVGGEPLDLSADRGKLRAQARRPDGTLIEVDVAVVSTGEQPSLRTAFATAVPAPTERERLLADAEQLASLGSWTLDLATLDASWSDGLYRIHGLAPQSAPAGIDLLLDRVSPEDRPRVSDLLESIVQRPGAVPRAGIDVEYRTVRTDGSVRQLRALGRVERDEEDRPTRWVGAAQDVTEQRVTERELHAHYAVGQALRDWDTFEEGVVDLLARLGGALDHPYGALWTWDEETQQLVCRAFWNAPGVATAHEPTPFEVATRAMTFGAGEGAPGKAFALQEPVIAEDLCADPDFGRPEAAEELGLRSGIAFPAVDHGRPLAVLTFYSQDRRAPTPRLQRTLTGIGSELGRFLNRRRAQLEDRRLSARELEVLRLATDGHTGPAIAERLFVSPATIKTHFEHIYEKLGVRDRAAAVALALRTGIID